MVLAGGRAEGGGREPLCSHAQLICTLGAIFRTGERNTSRSKKRENKKVNIQENGSGEFPSEKKRKLKPWCHWPTYVKGKRGGMEGWV